MWENVKIQDPLRLFFERFISYCEVEELGRSVTEKVADIYAELKPQGKLIEDADILVAATAIDRGLAVVTDNEKHFRRIAGLEVENWLK